MVPYGYGPNHGRDRFDMRQAREYNARLNRMSHGYRSNYGGEMFDRRQAREDDCWVDGTYGYRPDYRGDRRNTRRAREEDGRLDRTYSHRSSDRDNAFHPRQSRDEDQRPDRTAWEVCDRVPPGRITTSNRPLAYTYLTDRVLKAVVESDISPRLRSHWWSGDFDSNGRVRVSRQSRGDPVYDPVTGQLVVLTGSAVNSEYWLSGSPQQRKRQLEGHSSTRARDLSGGSTPAARKCYRLADRLEKL